MWSNIATFIFLILFSAELIHAQQGTSYIEIVSNAPDIVGQRLVYELKEQIRKSSAFTLVDPIGSRWQIVITSIASDPNFPNAGTTYAVVWNMVVEDFCGPTPSILYGDSTVGYCGTQVIASAAQTILARTDNLIASVRNSIRNTGE